jgi:predicted MarR family transcription regulator
MRRVPAVGDEVIVAYLNARESAVVEAVEDGGRALVVVTEHAEVVRLRLAASGWYVSADRSARVLLA